MSRRERRGEFIAGLPCKYKNGYSQVFDARATVTRYRPAGLSAPPPDLIVGQTLREFMRV